MPAMHAGAYAASQPQDLSFPPSAPLTPAEVPRGVRVVAPPDAWQHLTWLALDFGFDPCARKPARGDQQAAPRPSCGTPHAFSFKFDKPGTYHFTCSIHPRMVGTIVVQ